MKIFSLLIRRSVRKFYNRENKNSEVFTGYDKRTNLVRMLGKFH